MQPLDLTDRLIAEHVGLAMGAAAIPIPLADLAAVTLVQIDLVQKLAQRYDVAADRPRAREAVLALAGASFARLGASAVKVVPGAGWWLGGATHAALAGATTWALGQVYREQFESRGSLADPDADALRARYDAYVTRARALARDLRERVSFDDPPDERGEDVERLSRLRRAGILKEAEYQTLLAALSAEPEPAPDPEAGSTGR